MKDTKIRKGCEVDMAMKKSYEKPSVYIETFELNQHIASCDFIVNSQDVGSCYAVGSNDYFTPNDKLFLPVNAVCETPAEDYCTYNGSAIVVTANS